MSDLGKVFPPRDEWDIAAYNTDEVVLGYRSHKMSDAAPGDNHSPAFRWGWTNARKDITRVDDGYEAVRGAYIQLEKNMH